MGVFEYVWAGVLAVFLGDPAFVVLGIPVSITLLMVAAGFVGGIVVGATPGLAGPFAMAISLPILISIFGFSSDALLPVMGFLIGIMKGATVGGAVPAILFNTPGTPDALLTTFDGHPMARKGRGGEALRVAHFSSVSGDTVSDIVLFVAAPFLAVLVEAYLGFPEKTALILLSLSFIASVVGGSVAKGLIAAFLGLLAATVATGLDSYPRLSLGTETLAGGFPVITAVLGVLILGEVFKALEELWQAAGRDAGPPENPELGPTRLPKGGVRRLLPFIGTSAAIGTLVGALPGVGSTLAATLGYATGKRMHRGETKFGDGAPEGIAATEAANSAVSGANLIPVLSLGIPGNTAAVFLILAAESIGGFNPGPSVFRFTEDVVNPELVIAFGLFTTMVVANALNWTLGGLFMRRVGVLIRVPKPVLLPIVLLLTLTAIYVQETSMSALWFAIGFGFLGYLMRKLGISVLPFVIAFILAGQLEETARQAFAVTGGDPWFLFSSPVSVTFIAMAVVVVAYFGRRQA
ncbi:MAG: tripartite tricarboxylate transporter permease [Pseudomonadota bacterium]